MAFKRLAKVQDIPEDAGLRVEHEGEFIALFKHDGKIYAISDTCSHAEASLSEGEKVDDRIKCPEHGAEFSIIDGTALTFPAVAPVTSYEVKIDGDDIFIDVD